MKLLAASCRVSKCKLRVSAVITVEVTYFGDGLFNFEWAFKKLPKSIPEALKKDLTESKDMKIRHQLIKAKYF
ncbi:hypothetical protein MYX76_11645 [Desulfobacterota bacterium AH_259_B03_O07]|nr:hypothetical protein [Desulfobacterota bacterium AH_259_B03_O07]